MRKTLAVAVLSLAVVAPSGAPAYHGLADQPHDPSLPGGGPPLPVLPASSPVGHLHTWDGTPGDVAGDAVVDGDELIITDFPFDDRGADLDGSDGRSDDPTESYPMLEGANAATSSSGDYGYPPDPIYGNNAADIVEWRLSADEADWYVLVILNTLLDAERTAVELRLQDDATQVTLLMHGQTGTLDGVPIEVVGDVEQNTFEARVPRSVYDPGSRYHDAELGAGLWDPVEDAWLQPDPDGEASPWFDLGHLWWGHEPKSYWSDVTQSRILAGTEPPLPRRVCLALSPSSGGCSHGSTAAVPMDKEPVSGFEVTPIVRVFRSGQDLGEGIVPQERYDQDASSTYKLYRPRYQPYTVYGGRVDPDRPQPVVFLLHFLGGNHRSYPLTSFGSTYQRSVQRWADELGAIVVMPFARGEAGWYEGEAEIDVFEVWRDVATHYDIDPERVYLTGMSMGGYGTWRLGQLYPDLFARAISWAGPPTPYAIWPAPVPVTYPQQNPPMCPRDEKRCGLTLFDLMGNASNLPYLVIHGGADELVPFTGIEEWMSRASGRMPFRYILYPSRRHETSLPASTTDRVLGWLIDLPPRVRDPGTVSYTVVRDMFQPSFGITYDGAYWIDDLRLADDESEGHIRARAGDALRGERHESYGIDDVGPYRLRDEPWWPRDVTGKGVRISPRGFERASVDTARLGWLPTERTFVQVDLNDTPLRLRLIGNYPDDVVVEGMTFERDGSDIILIVPPGDSTAVLNPGADPY